MNKVHTLEQARDWFLENHSGKVICVMKDKKKEISCYLKAVEFYGQAENREQFIEKWTDGIKVLSTNDEESKHLIDVLCKMLKEDLDVLLKAEREKCAMKVKNLYLQSTGKEKGSRHLVQQSGKGMRDSYNLALADSAKAIREVK